jgi:hypothetical protein
MTRKNKQRKNNRTKKHVGGGTKLNAVIDYLIKTQEEISMMFKKNTYKIKFISTSKLQITQDVEGETIFKKDTIFEFQIKENRLLSDELIFKSTQTNDKLNIGKQTFTLPELKTLTEKTSAQIKEDLEKQKQTEIQSKQDELAKINQVVEANKEAIEMKETSDSYTVIKCDLTKILEKLPTGVVMPYEEEDQKYVLYYIETYFKNQTITPETIHLCVNKIIHLNKSEPIGEIKIDMPAAKILVQAAINTMNRIIFNKKDRENKKMLNEILSKMNAPHQQRKSKYTLEGECDTSMFKSDDFCFFVKCMQYYSMGNELVDGHNTVSNIVETGSDTGYLNLSYVSNGTKDTSKFIGFVVYTDLNTPDVEFKVSKIIIVPGKSDDPYKDTISKLNNIFTSNLNGTVKNSSLYIPSELSVNVNQNMYEKNTESTDGFDTWVLKAAMDPPLQQPMDQQQQPVDPYQQQQQFAYPQQQQFYPYQQYPQQQQPVQLNNIQLTEIENTNMNDLMKEVPNKSSDLTDLIESLPHQLKCTF